MKDNCTSMKTITKHRLRHLPGRDRRLCRRAGPASASGVLSRSLQRQLVPICCYMCMAVSLNLTVGISGRAELWATPAS